jgi:hypothetical protein
MIRSAHPPKSIRSWEAVLEFDWQGQKEADQVAFHVQPFLKGTSPHVSIYKCMDVRRVLCIEFHEFPRDAEDLTAADVFVLPAVYGLGNIAAGICINHASVLRSLPFFCPTNAISLRDDCGQTMTPLMKVEVLVCTYGL